MKIGRDSPISENPLGDNSKTKGKQESKSAGRTYQKKEEVEKLKSLVDDVKEIIKTTPPSAAKDEMAMRFKKAKEDDKGTLSGSPVKKDEVKQLLESFKREPTKDERIVKYLKERDLAEGFDKQDPQDEKIK